MAKRTRGLTEFYFENCSRGIGEHHDSPDTNTNTTDSNTDNRSNVTANDALDRGRLSVVIAVSGWQRERDDDFRAMGVIPSHMTARERLFRFYSIHNPDRYETHSFLMVACS
jgi:hypothetical protein